ncbi:PREDICTED: formin-like protein 6, partial [Rhinopithecus bieti]|uniref:formin-like protein 6 n=1 Tax=Rhinopithecus bieti TaxID=61621 RepID=UPI00083C6DA8
GLRQSEPAGPPPPPPSSSASSLLLLPPPPRPPHSDITCSPSPALYRRRRHRLGPEGPARPVAPQSRSSSHRLTRTLHVSRAAASGSAPAHTEHTAPPTAHRVRAGADTAQIPAPNGPRPAHYVNARKPAPPAAPPSSHRPRSRSRSLRRRRRGAWRNCCLGIRLAGDTWNVDNTVVSSRRVRF